MIPHYPDGFGLLYHIVDLAGRTLSVHSRFDSACLGRSGDQRILIQHEPSGAWLTDAPYPTAITRALSQVGGKAIAIPAISIRHVKDQTTGTYLLRDDLPFLRAIHDNGIFLTVPACAAQADADQRVEFYGIPRDLRDVFLYMRPRASYGWFMLDVDGDVVPGLPIYA